MLSVMMIVCELLLVRQCSDQQVFRSQSTQSHTRAKLSHKEFSAIVEANEPLKLVLIYTLASNTMLGENSIEARFGRHRLPTTIIQFDAVVINLSNQIAMQVDIRNAVNIQHLSVSILPIFASSDSGIHLAFDLTHERKVKWFVNLRLVWARMGAIATPCVTLDQLVSDCLHNVAILAYDLTEGVSDVSVGIGLVMHGKADIHGTVQIGHGFGLAQCRAGNGEGLIDHDDIIGTGSGTLGVRVDTLPNCPPHPLFYIIVRKDTLQTNHNAQTFPHES